MVQKHHKATTNSVIMEGKSGKKNYSLASLKQDLGHNLAKRLGLEGAPNRLFIAALTHPSYVFENPQFGKENNQRLEFLGDAILDFIIAEYLFLNYPDRPEGELTKMRAAVVNETTLAHKAHDIGLGQELLLGKGEQVSGGRERPSILADAWEALIGAIYLQYGFQEVRRIILELLRPAINEVAEGNYGDYKTVLQEKAQREEIEVNYQILAEDGPDHNKSFTAGVFLKGNLMGKGIGRTKKEAEQHAAKQVLEHWGRESDGET